VKNTHAQNVFIFIICVASSFLLLQVTSYKLWLVGAHQRVNCIAKVYIHGKQVL